MKKFAFRAVANVLYYSVMVAVVIVWLPLYYLFHGLEVFFYSAANMFSALQDILDDAVNAIKSFVLENLDAMYMKYIGSDSTFSE